MLGKALEINKEVSNMDFSHMYSSHHYALGAFLLKARIANLRRVLKIAFLPLAFWKKILNNRKTRTRLASEVASFRRSWQLTTLPRRQWDRWFNIFEKWNCIILTYERQKYSKKNHQFEQRYNFSKTNFKPCNIKDTSLDSILLP